MSDETKEEMCIYGFDVGLTESQIQMWIEMAESLFTDVWEDKQ